MEWSLYSLKRQKRRLLLLVVIFSILYQQVDAEVPQIPINGAISSVHMPDGSYKTYIDVVIGRNFSGKLPDEINSITVSGPQGNLSIGKDDFNFDPQSRSFWTVQPDSPESGTYKFTVNSGNQSGTSIDTQFVFKTVPIPDISKFIPSTDGSLTCQPPAFSWSSISTQEPFYYQLKIADSNHDHLYKTAYTKDMFSVKIPPEILNPGMTYYWQLKVADGPDWKTLNNQSQSQWVKFSANQSIVPCRYVYKIPVKTDDGWETSSLTKEGINSEYFDRLMADIFDGEYKDIHSIVVVKNGNLVFEEYFSGNHRNNLHVMASATKSVTSILVGIALDKKMIANVNRKTYELLPDYKGTKWIDERYEISLKNLLTMTAGIDWLGSDSNIPLSDPRNDASRLYHSYDPIKYTLEKQLIEQPGSRYNYSTGVSTVLGEIIKEASGLKPDEFAAKFLFDPLRIQDHKWFIYPNGTIDTGGGLFLRSRDMAKIGYMMLKKGRWNGKQIVSEEWVKESTIAHVRKNGKVTMGSEYGYQWHYGELSIGNQNIESFFAQGLGGQYIFIIPSIDMVVVCTFQHPESTGYLDANLIFSKYIIPSVLPQSKSQNVMELNSEFIKRYVGNYELKRYDEHFKVGEKNGKLYIQKPGDPKIILHPDTENTFYGNYKKIGRILVYFFQDTHNKSKVMEIRIGFLSVYLEKN
jgi:CubicO group peptidase (beta-lactamase class C family)